MNFSSEASKTEQEGDKYQSRGCGIGRGQSELLTVQFY